jgi:hypothetical protein
MTSDNENDDETEERDSTYGGSAPTDSEDQDIAAEHEEVIDRRRVDEMTSALDVVERAAELDEIRFRSEICDEQREQLEEAIEATLDAADAVWPHDEGVPLDD